MLPAGHPQCAYFCNTYDLLIHSCIQEVTIIDIVTKRHSWLFGGMMEDRTRQHIRTNWVPLHLIRWYKLSTSTWPKPNRVSPTCFIIIIITAKQGMIFWSTVWGHNAICSLMALLTSCSKCSHPNSETELWVFLISDLMYFWRDREPFDQAAIKINIKNTRTVALCLL